MECVSHPCLQPQVTVSNSACDLPPVPSHDTPASSTQTLDIYSLSLLPTLVHPPEHFNLMAPATHLDSSA